MASREQLREIEHDTPGTYATGAHTSSSSAARGLYVLLVCLTPYGELSGVLVLYVLQRA